MSRVESRARTVRALYEPLDRLTGDAPEPAGAPETAGTRQAHDSRVRGVRHHTPDLRPGRAPLDTERGTNVSTARTASTELRRFLTIAGRRFKDGRPAPEMFSPAVDAAWHELLGTPQYVVLCQETAGQPIGHTEKNGYGPITWVSAYEKAYGPLPEIWFTDGDGHVDQDMLARYRTTGTVVAEWDCSPTGGDGDDAVPDHPQSNRR